MRACARPNVTTLLRKTHGSKSARRYSQSPLEYAPATQNPRVQKRTRLPPEPSRARPCHGFAALETKSNDPSTQNRGGPKARAATARALWSTPLPRFTSVVGAQCCLMCVGWCEWVGVRWSVGVGERAEADGGRQAAGVQAKNKNPTQ